MFAKYSLNDYDDIHMHASNHIKEKSIITNHNIFKFLKKKKKKYILVKWS